MDAEEKRIELLFFGHIREIQRDLLSVEVPQSLVLEMIKFYERCDWFSVAHESVVISQTDKGRTVTSTNHGDYRNAYGAAGVVSTTGNRYEWKVRINKRKNSMMMGIASHRNVEGGYHVLDCAYQAGSSSFRRSDGQFSWGTQSQPSCEYETGDVVSILVDFAQKSVSFAVNDGARDTPFEGSLEIGPTYNLAVCLFPNGQDSVTIESFRCL